MGRLAAIVVLAAASFSACQQLSKPGVRGSYQPYAVRHAILHLEYRGPARGTEDLFIDSFGIREAHFIHSEQFAEEGLKPHITVAIKRGSDVTITDSIRMSTMHFIDKGIDSLADLASSESWAPGARQHEFFRDQGYRKVGDTVLQGLPSTVWQQGHDNVYLYAWKGIVVGRSISTPAGPLELVLRSIDTTSPIDPSRFITPKTFPVEERDPKLGR